MPWQPSPESPKKARRAIARAIKQWHSQLAPSVLLRLHTGLHNMGTSKPLTLGTMFSGTDLVGKLMMHLQRTWASTVGGGLCKWALVFQCESDSNKRILHAASVVSGRQSFLPDLVNQERTWDKFLRGSVPRWLSDGMAGSSSPEPCRHPPGHHPLGHRPGASRGASFRGRFLGCAKVQRGVFERCSGSPWQPQKPLALRDTSLV